MDKKGQYTGLIFTLGERYISNKLLHNVTYCVGMLSKKKILEDNSDYVYKIFDENNNFIVNRTIDNAERNVKQKIWNIK